MKPMQCLAIKMSFFLMQDPRVQTTQPVWA